MGLLVKGIMISIVLLAFMSRSFIIIQEIIRTVANSTLIREHSTNIESSKETTIRYFPHFTVF